MTAIHVDSLHTPEMVADEIRICLSNRSLTLGEFMSLRLVHSPYVYGGTVAEDDVRQAASLVRLSCDRDGVDSALRQEMEAVNRVLEILPAPDPGETQDAPALGPEWMCDLMAAAAVAVPSLTPSAMLWDVPLVLLLHLVAAACRRNSVSTRRPMDDAAAVRRLRQMGHSRQKKTSGPT